MREDELLAAVTKRLRTFKVERTLETEFVVMTSDDRVLGVALVTGVTKYGDALRITAVALPTHPLLGKRDPIITTSRNNVAYNWVR